MHLKLMAKRDSTFPRASELEPFSRIQFNVIFSTQCFLIVCENNLNNVIETLIEFVSQMLLATVMGPILFRTSGH